MYALFKDIHLSQTSIVRWRYLLHKFYSIHTVDSISITDTTVTLDWYISSEQSAGDKIEDG